MTLTLTANHMAQQSVPAHVNGFLSNRKPYLNFGRFQGYPGTLTQLQVAR